MRLTLRTLLAYLDDILDPADKEQLAKKIGASEFAEDLVHRTRDTMRRLRLSAPQVIGSGMGLDPNTVAEYLDNVLPPESVGDFERICLESDMHLAEAAACHHVLTMVLGEPAEVDPLARQRVYAVPAEVASRKRMRVEAGHAPASNLASVSTPLPTSAVEPVEVVASPAGVVAQSVIMEVPDYLRASRWSGMRGVLACLAVVLLVGSGLFFFTGLRTRLVGPPTAAVLPPNGVIGSGAPVEVPTLAQTTAMGDTLTNRRLPAPPLANETTAIDSNPAPGDSMASREVVGNGQLGPATSAAPQPGGPDAQSNPAVPELGGRYDLPRDLETIENLRPAALASPEGASSSSENAAAETAPGDIASDVGQNDGAPAVGAGTAPATVPPAPITASNPAPIPPQEAVSRPDDSATPGTDSIAMNSGTSARAVEARSTTSPAETTPTGPMELGTYLGGNTVLLRYDVGRGGWFRIEPRIKPIVAGDRLLALPEFRPKISLASGIHVDLSGGTQVIMGTAEEEPAEKLSASGGALPLVEVIYGRIILINTSNEEQGIRLKLGSSLCDARLARNARLGVDVERQYVPGSDPRKSPAPVVAHLYAPDGGIKWQDAAGERAIDNASRWMFTDGETSQLAADPSPPDWIDAEPVGQLAERRYGAPVVEQNLKADQPADIQLLELFQGNARKEVKSLVAKCCIHVGEFAPFIESLRDSNQRANWSTHIELLRAAMALSPESAKSVHKALNEQRVGSSADDLYEMLCGYGPDQIGHTPDEVKGGALARLVDWLDEDSLDYRVLAVHNLLEITGKRFMDNPAANPRVRERNVKVWRERLASGDLLSAGVK